MSVLGLWLFTVPSGTAGPTGQSDVIKSNVTLVGCDSRRPCSCCCKHNLKTKEIKKKNTNYSCKTMQLVTTTLQVPSLTKGNKPGPKLRSGEERQQRSSTCSLDSHFDWTGSFSCSPWPGTLCKSEKGIFSAQLSRTRFCLGQIYCPKISTRFSSRCIANYAVVWLPTDVLSQKWDLHICQRTIKRSYSSPIHVIFEAKTQVNLTRNWTQSWWRDSQTGTTQCQDEDRNNQNATLGRIEKATATKKVWHTKLPGLVVGHLFLCRCIVCPQPLQMVQFCKKKYTYIWIHCCTYPLLFLLELSLIPISTVKHSKVEKFCVR